MSTPTKYRSVSQHSPLMKSASSSLVRSPSSPFCTSPSQLQEVTSSDPELLSTFAYPISSKSPGDIGMRGRSVKEFEENLSNLKKENFNLKLRIYFLEERMGPDFNLDQENAVKKNIELKVEVENLKKELSDKQDLLCQAVKAMELEEEDYKKQVEEKDRKLAELLAEHEHMQQKYQLMQEEVRSQGDMHSEKESFFTPYGSALEEHSVVIRDLHSKIAKLEKKLESEQSNNQILQETIDRKSFDQCSDVTNAAELEEKISQMQSELDERNALVNHLRNDLDSLLATSEQRDNKLEEVQKRLDDGEARTEELEFENNRLQNEASDAQAEYEKVQRKCDKLKTAINQRNQRIVELEDAVSKYQAQVKALEIKLVSRPSTDWSTKASRGRAPKSPQASPAVTSLVQSSPATSALANSSGPATAGSSPCPSVSSTCTSFTLCGESETDPEVLHRSLLAARQAIGKLESEQKRACRIIQSMIESRRQQEKDTGVLKERLQQRDQQIAELLSVGNNSKGNVGSVAPRKSIQAAISERNLTAGVQQSLPTGSSGASKQPSTDAEATIDPSILAELESINSDRERQIVLMHDILQDKDKEIDDLRAECDRRVEQVYSKEDRIKQLEYQCSRHVALVSKDSFWIAEVEEKDREIDQLRSELKKRTEDLQSIVNKELWNKNREIEKLRGAHDERERLVVAMRLDIHSKDDQLKTLKDKIADLSRGGDDTTRTPEDKLRTMIGDRRKLLMQLECMQGDDFPLDSVKDMQHLRNETKQLQFKLDKSERLREQCNQICTVLSNRLEELAHFLDSLLKQKSVLGFLGNRENGKLRQIIDQSLDLSRSLNLNVSLDTDQSLLQLTNISNILNTTFSELVGQEDVHDSGSLLKSAETGMHKQRCKVTIPKDDTSDGRSDEQHQSEYENIVTPQSVIDNLCSSKFQIQIGSSLNTSTTVKYDNQSESEAWSEPDRVVSKERIGLPNGSFPTSLTDTTEDDRRSANSTTNTLVRTPSKRAHIMSTMQRQICDLEVKLNEKSDQLVKNEQSLCSMEDRMKLELEELDMVRAQRDQLSKKVQITESKLEAAEQASKQAVAEVSELKVTIDALQSEKDLLESGIAKSEENYAAQILNLEGEKEKLMVKIDKTSYEVESKTAMIADLQSKITQLYKEKSQISANLKAEYAASLAEMEQQMVEQMTERTVLLQQKYDQEYIKRTDVDRMLNTIKELETLQTVLNAAEEKIRQLEDNESELKSNMERNNEQHTEKLLAIRKELDGATLKCSELILEKTILSNDKCALEVNANDLKHQVEEFHGEFVEMKQQFNTQLTQLQQTKKTLATKLSEIEEENDDLRMKIAQMCRPPMNDAANSPVRMFQNFLDSTRHSPSSKSIQPESLFDRQVSDLVSSLTSEEQPDTSPSLDDRCNGNSSPDLGIESDQGRFSSMEVTSAIAKSTMPRPMQSTLQISENMSSLLTDADCNSYNDLCKSGKCASTMRDMTKENLELRQKLLSTRSAMEDTVNQLRIANKQKKCVEENICKQINKTSQVLRQAKTNLSSGSDSEPGKK